MDHEDFVNHRDVLGMTFAKTVAREREAAIKSVPGVEWFVAEIEHWKQRCEELEIELMMIENAYDCAEIDGTVKPKHRGIF